MKEFEYIVRDENGIHARPAGVIVNAAKKFDSVITLECRGKSADCKRLFSVMALGAAHGDTVKVRAEGVDEMSAAREVESAMVNAGL